jgi:carbon-monoxide dehydrogenase medium subunit/6-hydroxypseudooxynicotine dehydrogenase subunit alpha
MKPPPFQYQDPRSLPDAVARLAEAGDDAKVLAGGQSLIPLLNFRLARPAVLVDLDRVPELAYLRRRDGHLRIGAMCRQSRAEASAIVMEHWPLLTEALSLVAHPQIRHRGTVGGSAAHADPAAEIPVALTCLDATFRTRSVRGERVLSAGEFFTGYLTTGLAPDELLVEVDVPPLPAGTRHAFREHAARHGDFALGGAAVTYTAGPDGRCRRARIALLAAADVPLRAREAEAALEGQTMSDGLAREAAALATRDLTPPGGADGSGDYRRSVIETMLRRALLEAAA